MARERKKNTNTTPLTALLWVLAFIGRPFYFLISRIIIFFIFLITFVSNNIPKIKLEFLRINLFEIKLSKKLFRSRRNKIKLKKRYIVLLFMTFGLLTFYFLIIKNLPSPTDLDSKSPQVSTKIYDRNGNLLYKIYKNQNRSIVPLGRIPPFVRFATLAAEDAEFYNHSGFSIKGIFRSLIDNIGSDSVSGGSTITQQLVKNTLLSPEKTFTRKIKELILSIEVENNYTKDQILEMYLNQVSYGGTAYGIEEAANSYFGKDVSELNLAEAAMLAGLPRSPTYYSPFNNNPEAAFQRQRDVLRLMRVNKFITKEQEQEALSSPLSFVPNKTEIEAPHFVMYIRQLLVDKYGEELVEKGGLEVTTSLDLNIQHASEEILKDEVEKIKGLKVGNGAALVTNPQTGEILAMVGSKDYFNIKDDGNVNVLTRLRQPGSSIKLVNYAYALSKGGYTPATIIDDSPITYSVPGSPPYSPKNYDGKFIGNVTLRNALAESRNIPAVKVLASYGVPQMVDLGQKMGISSWTNPKNFGLSLTLGGGAVTGMDLAKVYSTVANGGKKTDFMPILQIRDYKGKLIEKNFPKSSPVLDPRVAYQLIDILKDNDARAPEFGFNSYLVVKDHPEVAVKTGTSNELRDNWTVGFNQNYLVLTWVGNNDNSEMSHIASGVTGASPIWNKIISFILNGKPSVSWNIPQGLNTVVCNGKTEYFLQENTVANFCKTMPISAPNIINNTEEQKVPQIM